jgi:hypothetical protein
MTNLPFPSKQKEIHDLVENIDERLLYCSSNFIRRQIRRPIVSLLERRIQSYKLDTPQAEWFNIYSIYSANQQLNESCNKLWATIELANLTSKHVWKKCYQPIGEDFSSTFMLGTLIPTLYYSQISAIISILSSFGCIPILIQRVPYYLLRTINGWTLFRRRTYIRQVLGIETKSWHDTIIKTYESLINKGIRLPRIAIRKTFALKKLRNEMHYEILGDLKMWRMFKDNNAYLKHLPAVIKTVETVVGNLSKIKKVTTGSDERFRNLKDALLKTSWYKH